ncbi:M10 family metallopeptidase C-terminal domain-containing protein, partial [Rubellimicrobium roseum]
TGLTIDMAVAPTVAVGSGATAATSDTLTTVENITAGSGDDTIFGNGAANLFLGGAGSDMLSGNGGNDNLFGDAGADELIGGLGTDGLTGGAGDDVFIFSSTSASTLTPSDTIFDFEGGGIVGGDIIDLSGVSSLTFNFIGTDAFTTGSATQVRYETNGTDTFVFVDTDADVGAEMRIRISGVTDLIASDFLL